MSSGPIGAAGRSPTRRSTTRWRTCGICCRCTTCCSGKLKQLDRLDWLAEEMDTWLRDVRDSRDRPRWRKVSGIGNLSPRSLAIVRELWLWRQRGGRAARRAAAPHSARRSDRRAGQAQERSADKIQADPRHAPAA